MSTVSSQTAPSPPVFVTAADVLFAVGDVPPNRVRIHPAPGTATEADLLRVNEDALCTAICELVDGTLVEKPMATYESLIAAVLITHLNQYVMANKLGVVLGEQGLLRLAAGLVRAPDVSFVSWDQFPQQMRDNMSTEPIWGLHPDLAVEVLSPSNTPREMERKLKEYFAAGTKLVWYLDPHERRMRVYRSETEMSVVDADGTLDGGDVLPGFRLELAKLFENAPPAPAEE